MYICRSIHDYLLPNKIDMRHMNYTKSSETIVKSTLQINIVVQYKTCSKPQNSKDVGRIRDHVHLPLFIIVFLSFTCSLVLFFDFEHKWIF